jgi:hypothetical protein
MHINKAIAGAVMLVFPILVIIGNNHSFLNYCYDFAGNLLPSADDMEGCDNFQQLVGPFLVIFLPFWVGGIFLLIFGLTEKSLHTGKKLETDLKVPNKRIQFQYLRIILSGILVFGTSLYLVRFLIPIFDWCPRYPDSYYYCIEPISKLPLILAATIPLLVSGTLFILHEIRKLPQVGNEQAKRTV